MRSACSQQASIKCQFSLFTLLPWGKGGQRGSKSLLVIFLTLGLSGPLEGRRAGQGLQGPGTDCTSSSTSAAVTAQGARVQQRPASLPYSWKPSIYALRPAPFFSVFFLPG
jgi:hypothetical protein